MRVDRDGDRRKYFAALDRAAHEEHQNSPRSWRRQRHRVQGHHGERFRLQLFLRRAELAASTSRTRPAPPTSTSAFYDQSLTRFLTERSPCVPVKDQRAHTRPSLRAGAPAPENSVSGTPRLKF